MGSIPVSPIDWRIDMLEINLFFSVIVAVLFCVICPIFSLLLLEEWSNQLPITNGFYTYDGEMRESGLSGASGKRVGVKAPWVQIPLSPLKGWMS